LPFAPACLGVRQPPVPDGCREGAGLVQALGPCLAGALRGEHDRSLGSAPGRCLGRGEYGYVISDEPTTVQTVEEYGLRFDIEENFLDDKSNGFQLESSRLRSAKALERLCFVLAMTTLSLVSVGTSVVQQGNRRFVDPHWFRGTSYLKIGWKWVSYALSRGYALITSVYLSSEGDPEPAVASKKQAQQQQDRFVFRHYPK
jgi:hypothetical protein